MCQEKKKTHHTESHIRIRDVTYFRDNIIELYSVVFLWLYSVVFFCVCKMCTKCARISYSEFGHFGFWFGFYLWVLYFFFYDLWFFVWTAVLFVFVQCFFMWLCVISFISRWYLNILTYLMGKTNMSFTCCSPPSILYKKKKKSKVSYNKKDALV